MAIARYGKGIERLTLDKIWPALAASVHFERIESKISKRFEGSAFSYHRQRDSGEFSKLEWREFYACTGLPARGQTLSGVEKRT